VALVLSALIWIIATAGGRQIFVKEVLGDAFDSQAEHFLRGNVDVDGDAIRWEAIWSSMERPACTSDHFRLCCECH